MEKRKRDRKREEGGSKGSGKQLGLESDFFHEMLDTPLLD